jgi:hypothetical protein
MQVATMVGLLKSINSGEGLRRGPDDEVKDRQELLSPEKSGRSSPPIVKNGLGLSFTFVVYGGATIDAILRLWYTEGQL